MNIRAISATKRGTSGRLKGAGSSAGRSLLWVCVAAAAIVWPLLYQNPYYQDVVALALIYILLGLGMNVLMGRVGLVHAGYAAFYGIGAYTVAIVMTRDGWSFWYALPLAVLVTAVLSVAISLPAVRVTGLYFVLVTLGFGQIFTLVMTNLGVTGGPNGLYGIPPPKLGSVQVINPDQLYWLVLPFVAVSFVMAKRLKSSRVGRAWDYIREDETAAKVLGVNPVWSKLQASVLAAIWAGLAGALFAIRQTAVAPDSFTFNESFIVILIVAIGGIRSLPGVIVGTIVEIVLPELLRPLATYRFLIFGLAIILMMLFRPEGLWPDRVRKWRKAPVGVPDAQGDRDRSVAELAEGQET